MQFFGRLSRFHAGQTGPVNVNEQHGLDRLV